MTSPMAGLWVKSSPSKIVAFGEACSTPVYAAKTQLLKDEQDCHVPMPLEL
jgi:hypothetical protein